MEEFKKLNKKLTDICYKLIENPTLCKLIAIDNENPLSTPDMKNTEELIFNRIVPYYTNPETITDSRTVLNVYFDNIKGNSNSYNGMVLIFRFITHESLKRIEGGSRIYEIFDVLRENFDKLSGLGLGGLEMDIGRLTVVSKDYDGMQLSFRLTEFK